MALVAKADAAFMRHRRLRRTPALRRLLPETRLHPSQLVLPVFVDARIDAPVAISALPAAGGRGTGGGGADVLAPGDMRDGGVAALRAAPGRSGHEGRAILSSAAKFASAYYAPFREAAGCAPRSGDRSAYQMDPPNGR